MKTEHKAPVNIDAVRTFWDKNPVGAWEIPFSLGTREYFERFDRLREAIEPQKFSEQLYGFASSGGKQVLEVGCGNGFVLSRYAAQGANVCGVDITPAGVDLCRKRFDVFGLPGNFSVENAEQLPFPNDHFDVVCSMGVLHHVPHPEQAVREIRRVLRPGGRLIVMVYHRNSALYRIKFPLLRLLTGKSIEQLVNEVDGVGNPKGDIYSESELRRLLSGFEEIKTETRLLQGWMVLPKIGRYIPDIMFRPFERRLGWFLYATGRKG